MGDPNERRFSNEFWITVLIFAISFTAGGVWSAVAFETRSHAEATYVPKILSEERWSTNEKSHERIEQALKDLIKELREDNAKTKKGKQAQENSP